VVCVSLLMLNFVQAQVVVEHGVSRGGRKAKAGDGAHLLPAAPARPVPRAQRARAAIAPDVGGRPTRAARQVAQHVHEVTCAEVTQASGNIVRVTLALALECLVWGGVARNAVQPGRIATKVVPPGGATPALPGGHSRRLAA
jgi:hypothetical protein